MGDVYYLIFMYLFSHIHPSVYHKNISLSLLLDTKIFAEYHNLKVMYNKEAVLMPHYQAKYYLNTPGNNDNPDH